MATMKTDGLDEVFRAVTSVGEDTGRLTDDMLLAAAEVVREEWRRSAGEHGHRYTGSMIESIGYARKPTKVSDVKSIAIYPQGKDKRGTRNAEKAYILHHGTKSKRGDKGIKGSGWVDEAEEAAGPKVERTMLEIYEKYLSEKGVY